VSKFSWPWRSWPGYQLALSGDVMTFEWEQPDEIDNDPDEDFDDQDFDAPEPEYPGDTNPYWEKE